MSLPMEMSTKDNFKMVIDKEKGNTHGLTLAISMESGWLIR